MDGERNRTASSAVSMPRKTSSRARMEGIFASVASFSIAAGSGFRRRQRMGKRLFFFLIGIVDQNTVIVVSRVFQPLEALVPRRSNLVDEHHALAGEAELHKSH